MVAGSQTADRPDADAGKVKGLTTGSTEEHRDTQGTRLFFAALAWRFLFRGFLLDIIEQ